MKEGGCGLCFPLFLIWKEEKGNKQNAEPKARRFNRKESPCKRFYCQEFSTHTAIAYKDCVSQRQDYLNEQSFVVRSILM